MGSVRSLVIALVAGVVLAPLPVMGAATGSIEGRVLSGETGRPVAGVALTLTSGTESGDSEVVARTKSDRDGRYRFEGLATGDDRFYALDARFQDGLFPGRPLSLPSDTTREPVIESVLRVWPTTTEPGVIAVRRDDMFVVSGEDGVGVIESVTILNTSTEAYIGRGAEMLGDEASGASFAFSMPNGSSDFNILDATMDIPEIVQVEPGLAMTVAIPPGEHKVTYTYRVPHDAGSSDLSRTALYPTLELSVYAADPLIVRSNRLVKGDPVTLEGKTYTRWSADEALDAGDPLQAIAIAQGTVPLVPLAIGVGLVIVALGGIYWVIAGRKRSGPTGSVSRDDLIERVARLDVRFEAGEIDEVRWTSERDDLVGRLRQLDGAGK